jgi:hypothetical protein
MFSFITGLIGLASSLWSALTGWKAKQAGRQEQAAADDAVTLKTVEAERDAAVAGKAESTGESLKDGTF